MKLGLDRQFADHAVEISPEEGMLLDWVLTIHSWEQTYLDWLMKPEVRSWREQAGAVIAGKEKTLYLEHEDVALLLAMVPITFRFAEKDVGHSLKVKLYKAYLGIQEVRDATYYQATDKTGSETPSSSEPTT